MGGGPAKAIKIKAVLELASRLQQLPYTEKKRFTTSQLVF